MLNAPIRVVLADDHEMVREALARILEESGTIKVVAQACDGTETLAAVYDANPAVVVMDYSMPGKNTVEVIKEILRYSPAVNVLVLTVHENIHYAVRVLEAGARGYLIKSAAVDELVEGIRTVHSGGKFISPRISSEVLRHFEQPRRKRTGLSLLSQREFDFLRLVGAGLTLQQCAARMKVSSSTASTYRGRIMEKLNLKSTADLVRFAIEQDIVG